MNAAPPLPPSRDVPTPHGRPTPLARWRNGLFAAAVWAGAIGILWQYHSQMDGYETGLLITTAAVLAFLGWHWTSLQGFSVAVTALSTTAIALYQTPHGPDLAQAQTRFWLQYLLSSQSAILWMGVVFALATVFYWLALWQAPAQRTSAAWASLARILTWGASTLALTGTLVRWYESHLLGPDMGHIPISNLYEVLVLFCWMTAVLYLYYESQYERAIGHLGAFVLPVICAAVGFIFWYSIQREGHAIEPLVPALQSWWMTLHVPANFIGYGAFAIAAMVAFVWLLQHYAHLRTPWLWLPLWLLGIALCVSPFAFRPLDSHVALVSAGLSALWIALLLALRKPLAKRLPEPLLLEELMYKAIALGFAFFTIATVLGALWAAEAWGGYWSWDPKETWALIVWLNYAAWLHLRLIKGLRGPWLAWWALAGLVITTFAFLGVNLFLGGLHSYGQL